MRLSAAYGDGRSYRVYDYPAGAFRKDLVWVDDAMNMVGVGFVSGGCEWVLKVERRKRVLIITALKWVALDLPEEEEKSMANNHVLTPVEAKEEADRRLLKYAVTRQD